MKITLPSWNRINPLFYAFALAAAIEVLTYRLWPHPQFLGIPTVAIFLLNIVAILATKALLQRLGKPAPGKKFVAEVLVIHWRGETGRFWGVYRYEWLAGVAAKYLAYVLDHLGDVHWEFGIQFRVHDREKRQAEEDASDAKTPQLA